MAKLLFITNSLSFGGAEKILCFVAESLAERGHEITIVNRGRVDTDTTYRRTFLDLVEVCGLTSQNKIKQIMTIRKIAKKMRADMVIGFTQMPNFMACVVGKSLHIPAVICERGDPNRTITASWKDKVVMSVINKARGGVFQTQGAADYYSEGLKKRGTVIPNPIFVTGEIPPKPEKRPKTVVSVGRLDNTQKRYDIMLTAFALFERLNPGYVLKLYGEGPDKEMLRDYAEELGIASQVKFMGLTTTPMQDIAGEGMFVITSDYEGISNALLEAMAVGLPCISTDSSPGGAAMLIESGVSGILTSCGDIHKLARAMCIFAEDEEKASSCGLAAKGVLNRFEPQKILDMWEQYLLSLLPKTRETHTK